jgi:long-chain acyl-CoA synthetase
MSIIVARWRLALVDVRLAPGDRMTVLLRNRVEWVCIDQAVPSLGLVEVPLYTFDHPGNIAYILEDSGARLLLVGDIQQWLAIQADQVRLPQHRHVLCMHVGKRLPPRHGTRVSSVADWLPFAAPPPLQAKLARDPHALATIVYTSGTTGRSEGGMLPHYNIL